MIEVFDENGLEIHLKAKTHVLALFYSSWCPFCRSFLSIFDKHAKNPGDTLFVKVKIDEDENPLWSSYSLEAVPSLILFEKEKVVKRLDCELGVGLNEKQFTTWLNK